MEEAGVEIELADEWPLAVVPLTTWGDVAILYEVRIVKGKLRPSAEAVAHYWMTLLDIHNAARRYDAGDRANGLVSGVGKRQWQMAAAFFKADSDRDRRHVAMEMFAYAK